MGCNMGRNSNPDEDGDDDPANYREHKLAKNPRASKPEDAGPRSPAEEKSDDSWQDLGDALVEDVPAAAEKAEDDENWVDRLEAAGAFDPGVSLEKADSNEEADPLWLSREDIEQAGISVEEQRLAVLEDIRDLLADGTVEERQRALKALQKVGTETDESDPFDRAINELDALEQELERREQAGEDGQTA